MVRLIRKRCFNEIVKSFAVIAFEMDPSSLHLEIKLYLKGRSSLKKGKIFCCIVP